MSINLDKKINLIYFYINDNINCYEIKNIIINKIKIDDIRISDNKITTDIFEQINKYKHQFLYQVNDDIYYKLYSDTLSLIIKLSLESIKRANNDALVCYILSEITLKEKLNILLPILNFDTKVENLTELLKSKTNMKFDNASKNKVIQVKLREGFNKINIATDYIKNTDNFNYKIFLFLIIYTLAKVTEKFNKFKHNNLTLNNIFIEDITEPKVNFKLGDNIYILPSYNFNPKITNFEDSFVSDNTINYTNPNLELDDITENEVDVDITEKDGKYILLDETTDKQTSESSDLFSSSELSEGNESLLSFISDISEVMLSYNVIDSNKYKVSDIIKVAKDIIHDNNLSDIIKLSNNLLQDSKLDLDTINFLKYIISLNMSNISYIELLNNSYFDEFKNNILNKKNNYTGKKNLSNINNMYSTKLKDTKDKILGNQKNLLKRNINDENTTRYIKSRENIKYSSKRTIRNEEANNDSESINNMIGGYDKSTVNPYKDEKNTPFRTNDERETFKKKNMENPPREPPVLIEQKIYDTSKAKQPPPPPPPSFIPVYNDVGSIVSQIPQYSDLTTQNPLYAQPSQKFYNINLSNPLSNFTTINKVFEDILPGDPRTLSFNSIHERIEFGIYMRNLIINNNDGEDLTINGGKKSLLSYVKLLDINPYCLNKNPFDDLAKNFLLFRSAYPIRYDTQTKKIEISKHAIGLHIRLYNMTIGEFRAENINKNISKDNFDLWREVKYYSTIKNNISSKYISPNFINFILYKIDSKSEIDWYKLSLQKKNNENLKKINRLHNEKDIKKLFNNNLIPANNKIILIWICDINNLKNNFWLDIQRQFKDNKDFNLNIVEKNDKQFTKLFKQYNITSFPTLLIKYNDDIPIKYNQKYDIVTFTKCINTIQSEQKLDITISSGNTLLLLTESPNTNIIKWASPIYESYGSQRIMISTGYHSTKVWYTILFQILYILTVLEESDIYFKELSLENNFYVKDLYYNQTTQNYWIYVIDDFEYYIPNYGYLVVFDSKNSDIDPNVSKEIEYKICSRKLFNNNNGTFKFDDNTFINKAKQILNGNNFKRLRSLGTNEIDQDTINILNNIEYALDNLIKQNNTPLPTPFKIKDIFIDIFDNYYLNNRIGTQLLVSEKELINSFYRPKLKAGTLLVYKKRYDSFIWVIYKAIKNVNIHTILLRDDNGKIVSKDINKNSLIGFPLNEKINLNGITEENIIEKFNIKNIN